MEEKEMKQIVISLAGRAIGITPLFSELEHFLQDYITEARPISPLAQALRISPLSEKSPPARIGQRVTRYGAFQTHISKRWQCIGKSR